MQRFFFFSSLNLKQFNCNSIKMYVIIYFMSLLWMKEKYRRLKRHMKTNISPFPSSVFSDLDKASGCQ